MEGAGEFIKTLFGLGTEFPVYICSLANDRDDSSEPSERHVSTRDLADIEKFVAKWDRPKRGLFFCVGTVKGARRAKENIAETIGLHADIDFKGINDSRADVERKLSHLPNPPSVIVSSGNGLHAYWLFKEAVNTQEARERIEAALKLLADLVGGDPAVCEVARLMRLPGTHNTKGGAFLPVEATKLGDERYELDDLEDWLAEQSPVILRKERPQQQPDTNPFLAAASRLGFKPPLDVEKRLSAMSYMAGGDASIHSTQLAVSASLLNAGQSADEVVATILEATKCAAGQYGERWNWKREEKAIRAMCESWLKKNPQSSSNPTIAQTKITEQAVNGKSLAQLKSEEQMMNGGTVVNLAAKRKERKQKQQVDKQHLANAVADGVIEAVRTGGQDLILTEGEIWLYADGIWHVMTPADQQWLLTLIQTGFETLGEPAKNANLSAAWKRLTEHPELFQRTVEWANSDVIVCQNGVLEITSRTFHPHGPQWFARRKIGTTYDPAATCPKFLQLLNAMFADRGEDAAGFVNVI